LDKCQDLPYNFKYQLMTKKKITSPPKEVKVLEILSSLGLLDIFEQLPRPTPEDVKILDILNSLGIFDIYEQSYGQTLKREIPCLKLPTEADIIQEVVKRRELKRTRDPKLFFELLGNNPFKLMYPEIIGQIFYWQIDCILENRVKRREAKEYLEQIGKALIPPQAAKKQAHQWLITFYSSAPNCLLA